MKKKAILLIPLALSLFLIGLPLADETMASEPTLRMTIDPRTGPPGTAISVTGEGAHTDKLVKVAFVTSGEGGTSLAEVEVTPQLDGTFTATLTVPNGTGGGTYAVRAEQTNPSTGGLVHYWYCNFNVTGAAPATLEATPPAEPTVSETGTVTATAAATPAATTTVTPTTVARMPTTGEQDFGSNNTMVVVIAILATLGVLVALGAGLRQARKA